MADSPKRDTLIFICTANICRSPMAAALAAHALSAEEPPLNQLKVDSAGVSAYSGEPVSPESEEALKRVGINLEAKRSRRLNQKMIERSLAIFGMTESHRHLVRATFELPHPHLYLMREFMDGSVDVEIPDPFGLNYQAYEAARDSMVEAIPSLLRAVRDILDNPNQPLNV